MKRVEKMANVAKPTRVPRLRFPAFGDEPAWDGKKLGEVSEFSSGGTPSKNNPAYWNGTIPWISASSMYETRIFTSELNVTHEAIGNGTRIARQGSLLILVRGSMLFNRVPICIASVDVAFNQDVKALSIDRSMSGDFLLHQLLAMESRIPVDRTGIGAGKIETEALAQFEIGVPSSAEQQKIAECLSTLDELIVATSQKLDALKAHKKGLMQQLFPREGETVPRLRFPEFHDAPEWKSDSLGEVFDTASGGTPSRAEKSFWNGAIPWVTTSLVDFRVITGADEFITAQGLEKSSAKLFPKGTVLMAMYGQGKTRGQVALLGIEATTNQACAAILPRSDIDPYFVFLSLAGRYEEIRRISNSGGQENLSQDLIRSIAFSYPQSEDEQRRVTHCLSSLDELIAAQGDQLEALKTHKKGLMQQLFPSPSEAAE